MESIPERDAQNVSETLPLVAFVVVLLFVKFQ
jgi:hypothetical protein